MPCVCRGEAREVARNRIDGLSKLVLFCWPHLCRPGTNAIVFGRLPSSVHALRSPAVVRTFVSSGNSYHSEAFGNCSLEIVRRPCHVLELLNTLASNRQRTSRFGVSDHAVFAERRVGTRTRAVFAGIHFKKFPLLSVLFSEKLEKIIHSGLTKSAKHTFFAFIKADFRALSASWSGPFFFLSHPAL